MEITQTWKHWLKNNLREVVLENSNVFIRSSIYFNYSVWKETYFVNKRQMVCHGNREGRAITQESWLKKAKLNIMAVSKYPLREDSLRKASLRDTKYHLMPFVLIAYCLIPDNIVCLFSFHKDYMNSPLLRIMISLLLGLILKFN